MSNTVILINPDREKPQISPPALDHMALSLKRAGFEPDLLDLALEPDWYAASSEAVSEREVLAVVILLRHLDDALLSSQTFFLPKSKTLVEYLRSKTKAPVILLGGAFSIYPEAILKFCRADYGIIGDADVSLPALVKAIAKGDAAGHIPNIAWMEKKKYCQNKLTNATLTKHDYTERSFVNNRRYQNEGGLVRFETKRGCTQQTVYGINTLTHGSTLRLKSPKAVAEEMAYLVDQNIFCLEAMDVEFNLPMNHALAVCDAVQAKGIQDRLTWFASCSPLEFTAELAGKMTASGCVGVRFRIDSGDPGQLERLGCSHTTDDILIAAENCKEAGFGTMFEVLIGGPGETRDSISNTLALLKQIKPDMVTIRYGVRVYPNTPLGEAVRHDDELRDNYHLRGAIYNNANLLRPVFYVESLLGRGVEEFIEDLIEGDQTYLFPFRKDIEKEHNYNDSSILIDAIIKYGHRGPEWEIFRRLILRLPPLLPGNNGNAAVAA